MAFETDRQNLTGTDTLDPEEEERDEDQEGEEEEEQEKYGIGVLAGLEWSPVPNAELTDRQKTIVKSSVKKASRRDYPARLIEVIQAWEAALFYRGFQFLLPQTGGGWEIPGESTGYGPSMQMDLSLMPTNIYSARAQMIVAALTRTVPTARFGPEHANSAAQITAAESAEKFAKVIRRNIDPIQVQTDAARYLWTDGRYGYWSRFVKDGQRFGWEEDDEQDDLVPENEPLGGEAGQTKIEGLAAEATPESTETAQEGAQPDNPLELPEGETRIEAEAAAENTETEEEEKEEDNEPVKRTPRGQEVRTAHGKLEMKLTPMFANTIDEVDVLQLELEVDVTRAKGMCPWIADKISAATNQPSASNEIGRLARQNVKLGMQSTYVTSDSIAADATVLRSWIRPSYFFDQEGVTEQERDELIEMFPNGCYVMMIGDEIAFARNESMDDSWALAQAYSGDGQNRNAMGTSTLPIQKRLNNWLDLMNDIFVRTVPKKWMDSKAFAVDTIKQQTNVPGDIGSFKRVPGTPVTELIFVEPAVNPPMNLADFIKEYSGPLAELLSGAYPALAGGDVGTADSGVAIATQRDSALGRLAPTWHQMKNCECTSMKQLVRWGAKCRDKSINEKIPGGETIKLEINDLKSNITVYAESDENFPETYTQRKNAFMQVFTASEKNPQLQEVLYNPANLELLQNMTGLSGLVIPQVLSYRKQLGEIDVMLSGPGPQPSQQAQQLIAKVKLMKKAGVPPEELQAAEQEIMQLPMVSSVPVDSKPKREDHVAEAMTCWIWMNGEEGRRTKRSNPEAFEDIALHFDEHTQQAAAEAQAAQAAGVPAKPPSMSIGYKDVAMVDKGASDQMLQKGGITPTPAAPGSIGQPGGPPAGPGTAPPPAAPIPTGAPEGAGGIPKH